ncbi:ATP-dependent nuclease [Winogradskyella sp. Asnod2-B02-A]|uniref:ATP-dependent nuclease n=1 Tax=Winogradskyella sp. Asnod2-B02-A TaxID=3160583 RepID=UPI00386785DF
MRIKNIKIHNFRLLSKASLDLEDDITLIVGRNNTGKTSLLEVIKVFLSSEDKLSFEDFSQSSYSKFKELYSKYVNTLDPDISEEDTKELEQTIQKEFPKIQLQIEFEYDKIKDSLINLSEFITDLDENRNDACVLLSYESYNAIGVLKAFHNREERSTEILQYLKDNIKSSFKIKCFAKDILTQYTREIDLGFREKVRKVVVFQEIKAMRILDDKKSDSNKTLATGFSKYYNERDRTDDNVKEVENSLKEISVVLKEKYDAVLDSILGDLKKFGAKTPIVIPEISIASEFDSESVIKNNIKYYYRQEEIDLPESYNGLGYSNLIYMVLELASFIEHFRNSKEEKVAEFLTVLIEEPEAHMHPQMQQVFISQIKGIVEDAEKDGVFVQLIISSHSSHILSEAGIDKEKGFRRIRYFNRVENKIQIKDFNKLRIVNEQKTARFLRQYLTLHKSDLFFSDKVIIVEGTTERMLLPQMIRKVAPDLVTEYVSILEVGGAYTHKFKEILEFLNLKTLIITDIDSVDSKNGEKCPVNNGNNGELTSNQTLKNWLPKKATIKELIEVKDTDKVESNLIKIAYQTEENGKIGRSLEEAFIIANLDFLKTEIPQPEDANFKPAKEFSLFIRKGLAKLDTDSPYNLAPVTSGAKTNFTFDLMSFPEDKYGDWNVPKYISEGLKWLVKPLESKIENEEIDYNED